MSLLGLHPIDWLVIILYFIGMVAIGLWARKRVRDTQGFFQGNRSFGRILVTFLNFGSMTDAGQAASVTREIYRQGLQGVWFQNLVLFHTPFQWFIAALQRRARYLAPGDMFLHRFESRFLAGLYAAVLLAVAVYANSFGYLLTGKTIEAMTVKPVTEYTAEDTRSVKDFERMQSLKARDFASLSQGEKNDLSVLQEREKHGEIRSFISYLDLNTFYIVYALLIAAYTVLGGLFAVALIDVVQGALIVFLSLSLIPAALGHIGGIAGLQAKVPAHMFELFGSTATSDYTWYFVASFALLNLVVNAPKSFTIGGAAKDDNAARIGFVSGAIFKRFMMIGWAVTGLLAIGLYSGKLSDPTNIWGVMTRDLLGAGAIGLMIAAIFSANMDGNATISLESAASLIKNVLLPFKPDISERRQVLLGRIIVSVILLMSVFLARRLDDVFIVFKYILSVGTIVGPAFWLVYFWRKLNTRAVAVQMICSIIMVIAIPNIIPAIPNARLDPGLTVQTDPRVVSTPAKATEQDVKEGRAASVGQTYMKSERIPPKSIYFESIARVNPQDTTSPMEGKGLFRPQLWLLGQLGVDFRSWSGAGLSTASFLFDAIMPFLILILVSLFTRRNSESVLNDFYARIHTPAVADPALDAELVQRKIDNPDLVEQDKVFPGTDIEFWKPTRTDIVGFLACIGFVLLIVGLYMAVASIGS